MNSTLDLAYLFEHAPCGLVTTQTDGTILRANATFCGWLGYSLDEIVDKRKIQELFTIGGRFFHHTHWAPLLQLQGSVSEVQIDIKAKNGSVLPMLINGSRHQQGEIRFDQLAFFLATERKNYERELITARKSVEESLASLRTTQEKLQESRDMLGIALRSARMGVWSQNLIADQIWWSPELQQLTGHSDNEYWESSQAFYQIIHPDDRSQFIAEIEKAIESKSDYNVQFRIQHKNDSWLTMETRGHATYTDEDQALSIVGIIMDISDRKAAEEQLNALNQQLSIADRRKDEFLATLGHELRNPLAPICNVLEIMRAKETDDTFMHWSRDMIERHVSQLTHLVDDLLEASRISQGRLSLRTEPINIDDAVQNAVESVQDLMKSSEHHLTVNKPQHPIIIDADATRITQIIVNLLTNAGKYTPKGGDILLNVFKQENEAIVSVKDTGIGIPAEQLTNVFNMFSQLTPALDRAQGGLGIGLSLVHGLVKLHGGNIVALSDGENQGSEFIVSLPIITSPQEALPKGERAEDGQKDPNIANHLRILIIEDNVDAAESLSFLLEFNGHTTRVAYDGASGLSAAEEFRPNVVLLDIGLPDLNGYQVAGKIRETSWGKDIFLIAATGWGQDKDKALAQGAGFDRHLVKPIDYSELTALLSIAVLTTAND
ncbi:PAS domain-containing hybrid sensor histidine kinase/response regulator [Paraglaciecola chathamensis]|uniref:histidine kinase n=1 Tax=Paraglaciecola chathamensis TaxID=368405 RepID=A0A8H9IEU2_9ALTE|nr:PAS domain-containing hybrid sensor histidine kinase/response regulator [Paraglaciecola oceanifecundans]GGZ68124.1 hypothetical protein GCM10011274_28440 [Paraglaciecola oceanifecundans]